MNISGWLRAGWLAGRLGGRLADSQPVSEPANLPAIRILSSPHRQ